MNEYLDGAVKLDPPGPVRRILQEVEDLERARLDAVAECQRLADENEYLRQQLDTIGRALGGNQQ